MRFFTDFLGIGRWCARIGAIIPPCCAVCGRQPQPISRRPAGLKIRQIDLCEHCESHFPRILAADGQHRLCLRCGSEHMQAVCKDCAGIPPLFKRIIAPYRYDFPTNRLIQSLKYGKRRPLARVLGELLACEVAQQLSNHREQMPELLIPVPAHVHRIRQRGFDHASDIARFTAKALALKFSAQVVSRSTDTVPMAGLSRVERSLVIRGAFEISDSADSQVAGRRLAIIDDVMTSGATAGELARELYDTGAESVELWVLARTASAALLDDN